MVAENTISRPSGLHTGDKEMEVSPSTPEKPAVRASAVADRTSRGFAPGSSPCTITVGWRSSSHSFQ